MANVYDTPHPEQLFACGHNERWDEGNIKYGVLRSIKYFRIRSTTYQELLSISYIRHVPSTRHPNSDPNASGLKSRDYYGFVSNRYFMARLSPLGLVT